MGERWVAEPGSRLAQLRQSVHRAFDPRWKYGGVGRGEAYAWFAKQMDLPVRDCHIGMFDEADCERALSVLCAEDFA